MKIKDIIKPRAEVLNHKFQGALQANKADSKEKRLENDANSLLEITYLSNAIKSVIHRVNDKLSGKTNQGCSLLSGPYGSGKTHGLITLFHLFNDPVTAKKWLNSWNEDFKLHNNSKAVIVSAMNFDGDYLWEPIFTKLGRKDLLKEVKRVPTTDIIEKLVGDGTLAIFLDEVERWYNAFDSKKDKAIMEANKKFLQALTEVASDHKRNLFVLITFLNENDELKEILNRTKPFNHDMSSTGDREKLILHRLFESSEKIDAKKVKEVVLKYLSKYEFPIEIKDKKRYENKMIECYPFHPELLKVLDEIYESATERQSVRGLMNALADMVADKSSRTDLLLISDLDENDFRSIDMTLVSKYKYDVERNIKGISYGQEILKVVLIHTLNDKEVGTIKKSDILISVFKPTDGMTLNQVSMALDSLVGNAHYLHTDGKGGYLIKKSENLMALVEKEKKTIKDEEALKEMSNLIRRDVFDNQVFIYNFDEIPEDSKPKFIITLGSIGEKEELEKTLEKFFKGKTWQNTYIFIVPSNSGPEKDFEIVEKVKRIIAGKILQEKDIEDKEKKLKQLIQQETNEVINLIKKHYGRIVEWTESQKIRLKSVEADMFSIKERVSTDKSYISEHILKEVKTAGQKGIKVEFLLSDFKKYRRLPLLLDEESFYSTIRDLLIDNRIIIEGDRGVFYTNTNSPRQIEPSYTMLEPKWLPETPASEEGELGKKEEKQAELKPGERLTASEEYLEGNVRKLVSLIESRFESADKFDNLKLEFEFSDKIEKEELMKFIKKLPDADRILATLRVWKK